MMNMVALVGRMVRDPELRTTSSGNVTTRFTLAVTRDYKNKSSGEYESDFPTIVAWGKTAEYICKYFKKGNRVSVVGSLRTGSYEKDGQKIYTTEIEASKVGLEESRPKSSQDDTAPSANNQTSAAQEAPSQSASDEFDNLDDFNFDDDF